MSGGSSSSTTTRHDAGDLLTEMGAAPGIALAAVSGALYAACYPPSHLWPLAFFSWVPLLVALHGRTVRASVALGLVQGFVANVIGLSWLVPVIQTFAGARTVLSVFLAILFWIYGAGAVAVPCFVSARARRNRWPAGGGFVLGLMVTEAFYPLVFSSYTGAQVHSLPLMMQLADVGGPILVGVPLSIANVALGELVVAAQGRRAPERRTLLVGLLAPALAVAYGMVRMRAIDAEVLGAAPLDVAVVQPNTPHEKVSLRSAARIYRTATAKLDRKYDLIVWSETALSQGIQLEALERTINEQVLHTPEFPEAPGAPLLTGAMVARGEALSNSAVLVDGSGRLLGEYDKVHPLVIGEYVPFADVFPILDRLIPNAGRLAPGARDQAALLLDGHRITPLICYEDVIPAFAREAMAATHGELIVDLTNDSWFGDSRAAALHEGLAKFRAVEHRRFLVHAAASGISSFIDPVGRALRETRLREAVNIEETVRWLDGTTVFERIGDSPKWGALALALIVCFVGRRPSAASQ